MLNIAHRGARSLAPENTLLAAQKAHEIGADLWETDVTLTADHQLILMHDDTLLRTTDVYQKFPQRKHEPAHHFSLAEIRRLDAGTWFVESDPFGQIAANELIQAQLDACRGEKVPTLEEALVFTRERDWRINLEIKPLPSQLRSFPIVPTLLAIINRTAIDADRVIFSSFDHRFLREISSLRPDLTIQALIGGTSEASMDWGGFEFQTYNANHQLIDETQIKAAHGRGKKINLYTVNEISQMKYYSKLGIAGIFTDFPQRLKRVIACEIIQ